MLNISNNADCTDSSVSVSILPQNEPLNKCSIVDYITERQIAFQWIIDNKLTAIPVAPLQDPWKYPKKSNGEIVYEKDGVTPEPLYSGKCPSYLDEAGIPYILTWDKYKKQSPTDAEYKKWFLNPLTGIGAILINGVVGFDLDTSKFNFDQSECDAAYQEILTKEPALKDSYIERTHSGGYHILGKVRTQPSFSKNMALEPGGKHVGELLQNGGFVVLAPSIGKSGNPYTVINRGKIVEIESVNETVYPYKKSKEAKTPKEPKAITPQEDKVVGSVARVANKPAKSFPGVSLDSLISDNAKAILTSQVTDRSEALATYCNEALGWITWCNKNDVSIVDNYQELAESAGVTLGIDGDKIQRILATIDTNAIPSAEHNGGDVSCWKKISKLNKDIYKAKCPIDIKQEIIDEFQTLKAKTKDKYEVQTTAEDTMLISLFDDGVGDWKVIKDAYHQYTGNGHWKFIGDDVVQKKITDYLRKFYWLQETKDGGVVRRYTYSTDSTKNSTFKFCRSNLTQTENISNDHLLCFRNGTVDVRTGELSSHNRKDFITSTIDVDYVKNADCPEVFKNFICNSFGEKFLPLIQAMTAMYLDPTALYGYFAHIIGQSGSGKGTLIRFWGEMFGIDNVRSLQKFEDVSTPEKRHQMLTGIKFCSFPDMGGFQKDLRAFYELVDNGGLSGRALFSSTGYERRWNTRFAIASVDFLTIENSGDGWARRAIQIPTLNRTNEVDTELGQKLRQCTSEVISWALSMPRQQRDNLIKNAARLFEEISEAQTQQKIMGDSVSAFVESCLSPSNDDKSKIDTADLYDYYVSFCKAQGLLAKGSTGFLSHLKIVLPNNFVQRKSIRQNGSLVNVAAHYYHIKVVSPRLFTQSNSYDTTLVCAKKQLSEGGIKEFATYWQRKASGITGEGLENLDAGVPPFQTAIEF